MNRSLWRGRKVFVTGHTGFKGGWLSVMLAELGAEVTGFALEPSGPPNLFVAARVGERLSSCIGDVRQPEALERALSASRAEVVLHLAAQPLVLPSYERPADTYATNVMGTVHLLEACRRVDSVRAVVIVTSDKCYENRGWHWGYRENDRLGGHDPYSNSKACAELVTAAYRRSFLAGKVGVASVRAGNVIGGGDFAQHRIVPDFARAAMAGEALVVRNPRHTRPWQFVLEPLEGYLLVAERLLEDSPHAASPWNFAPPAGAIQSVERVVTDLCAAWGAGARWQHRPQHDQAPEDSLLALDSTRAQRELGWRGRLGYDEGLRWTVEWYKAFAEQRDCAALTRAQVQRYLELPA